MARLLLVGIVFWLLSIGLTVAFLGASVLLTLLGVSGPWDAALYITMVAALAVMVCVMASPSRLVVGAVTAVLAMGCGFG